MAETKQPNNVLKFRPRNQDPSPNAIKQEQATQGNIESLYQAALAEDRAARGEDVEVERINADIKPPSSGRYVLALYYAIILDVLDIVEDIADISIVGILFTIVIDIILDLPLIWLGFSSSRDLKKIGMAEAGITEKINAIRQRIMNYRSRYALILRASRKVNVLRKPARAVARKFKATRRIITKSVLGRFIWTAGADLIPIIDLIPFRTWGVYSSHKQHKKAYEEFQLLLSEDYYGAREEEIEANNDVLALEQEEEYEADSEYEETRAQQEADERPPVGKEEDLIAA